MMSKYSKWHQLVSRLGLPEYRLSQIKHAVFQRCIGEYERMDALPLSLRNELTEALGPHVCGVTPTSSAQGKQVQKTLFRLQDGQHIETVALSYRRGWSSYCLSSQCGCALGCTFCATGAMGFSRNMSAEEITDQLLHFYLSGHSLDSISFMGMGEPLMNPHLLEALRLLTDPTLFALGQRRITISTTGVLPGLREVTAAFPQVNIAFSLHTPFNRQRSELMPINRKYSLREVLVALDVHAHATNRKVFLAYTLLGGINDSDQHLHALIDLVNHRPQARLYQVDLIPYNPGGSRIAFSPPDSRRLHAFQSKLISAGIHTTVRAQFGADIEAACGQLCAQSNHQSSQSKQDGGSVELQNLSDDGKEALPYKANTRGYSL